MKNILVIGSISIDNTVFTSELSKPGETTIADSYISNVGGKGANQACAAHFLGAKVFFYGAVGNDDNGHRVIKFLKDKGLPFCIKDSKAPTGVAFITINKKNAENSIYIVTGANEDILVDNIKEHDELFTKNDIFLTQFEYPIETVEYSIKKAKEKGMFVIVNPAPAKVIHDEIYHCIDILVPNEHELVTLSSENDLNKGIEILHKKGAKQIIVTLGEKGSFYHSEKESFKVEPVKVNAIDTTAAGDSYLGALAFRLSQGKSIKEAMEFASRCSAITVSREGAIIALPHKSDIM